MPWIDPKTGEINLFPPVVPTPQEQLMAMFAPLGILQGKLPVIEEGINDWVNNIDLDDIVKRFGSKEVK